MVARLVRDQEVVGSNPVASTNKNKRVAFATRFFKVLCIGRGTAFKPPLPFIYTAEFYRISFQLSSESTSNNVITT